MKFTKSQQQIKINPLIKWIMDDNNPTRIGILNELIVLGHQFRDVFPSQGRHLSKKLGVSRQHINTSLSVLKKQGLVQYKQRGFNKSCIYFVNPLLIQEKERLKWKLPALRYVLCVSMLCNALFAGNITLSNIGSNQPCKKVILAPVISDFYEPRNSKELPDSFIFFEKQSITTEKEPVCLKGSVMSQQAVINLIAESYGLSKQQEEMLSNYSDAALEYAVKELYRQNKQTTLNAPVNWIASVARNFEVKASHPPKMGRRQDFGASNERFNPNHSNAKQAPNMTREQRIDFLRSEIANYTKIIDNPQNYFVAGVDGSLALSLGKGRLKDCQDELAALERGGRLQEASAIVNAFKDEAESVAAYGSDDPEYEAYLDEISKDKFDPQGYKLLVRKYEYRRKLKK